MLPESPRGWSAYTIASVSIVTCTDRQVSFDPHDTSSQYSLRQIRSHECAYVEGPRVIREKLRVVRCDDGVDVCMDEGIEEGRRVQLLFND